MAYLQIVAGFNQGARLDIDSDITIGRSPENRVCLPDTHASRKHAVIQVQSGIPVVMDLGSANGTLLNEQPMAPNTPCRLNNGDQVRISSTIMVFNDGATAENAGTQPQGAQGQRGLLSMLMDEDSSAPAVEASIDASISLAEIREEEKTSEKGLMEAVKRLQAMVKVSVDLGAVTKQSDLLDRIMSSIFDIFPHADRAFILMRNKQSGEMEPTIGRNRKDPEAVEEKFPVSRKIIKTVVEKKQSVLCSDAQKDDRFAMQQSIIDLSIRSVMCVPFICQNEILGVINVDTVSGINTLKPDDLTMLTGIASQAAIALKNAELYVEIEEETERRAHLSRYMSPDVAEAVMDGSIPLELGGKKARGTVFFCDIVGFTKMSEKLPPMGIVEKLNRYFSVTTEIVTRNKGTLHKFGGDMIMAFWNVMFPDEMPEANSIRTSIEMQSAVWSFDLDLVQEGQSPIYLGIGCNTGEFAAGNIGGEDRMEYTIIGDNVNLGQRIESMAGRWQVFVSQNTYEAAQATCMAVTLPPTMVKGKSAPINIYSIRGIQVDPEMAILTIPVRILDASGNNPAEGMLTHMEGSGNARVLWLSTQMAPEKGTKLDVEFELPELCRKLKVSATAEEVNTSQHEGETVYSKIKLTNLQCDQDTDEFLQPGTLFESKRSWDELERH